MKKLYSTATYQVTRHAHQKPNPTRVEVSLLDTNTILLQPVNATTGAVKDGATQVTVEWAYSLATLRNADADGMILNQCGYH